MILRAVRRGVLADEIGVHFVRFFAWCLTNPRRRREMPRLLKRAVTVCLFGILCLVNSATSAFDSGSHFAFAYMQYGCAPTDAEALDFYFTARKGECGKYTEPFLKISVWKNLPKSAPYSMKLGGGDGGAIRCLKPGACEAASSGSLRLDKFINERSSSGEYELHFRDGSVEKDKFDATSCYIKFVCG